eukprot:CAMPEP_0119526872 /NCGR_PEP_ID=MMETSP1344-20130328/41404_1 /TAXON_ID=236787 /ORGANISM="Florenciella parvula, Strain CCMP2471" /LENGTH=111 /DNA_ID=CAMNT_0007565961 /DNA_START=63 /DNA_END=396 /DNA_ORIENTATION=-
MRSSEFERRPPPPAHRSRRPGPWRSPSQVPSSARRYAAAAVTFGPEPSAARAWTAGAGLGLRVGPRFGPQARSVNDPLTEARAVPLPAEPAPAPPAVALAAAPLAAPPLRA